MAESSPPTGVRVTIRTVTPDQAHALLGLNNLNRNVRRRHVKKLAGAMARGEWQLNGDAIRVSEDGELLDGQHRLLSCIEADTPFITLVIEGLPKSARSTIDVDTKPRSLADILRFAGEQNVVMLGAAITWCWRFENQGLHGREIPTSAEAFDILEKHPGLREVTEWARKLQGRLRCPVGPTCLFLLQALSYGDDGQVFFERLVTGTGFTSAKDPIYTLREWIIRQATNQQPRGTTALASALAYYVVMVKAWNAWREGREIQSLRWQPGGARPEGIPEMR